MKFKLLAALRGLMIAIPGAVSAQNPDESKFRNWRLGLKMLLVRSETQVLGG